MSISGRRELVPEVPPERGECETHQTGAPGGDCLAASLRIVPHPRHVVKRDFPALGATVR